MAGFFKDIPQADVDEVGVPFLKAIIAMIEFARPRHDEADDRVFDAGVTAALLESLVALVVHPHTDAEQDEELIAGIADYLRTEVAARRAES